MKWNLLSKLRLFLIIATTTMVGSCNGSSKQAESNEAETTTESTTSATDYGKDEYGIAGKYESFYDLKNSDIKSSLGKYEFWADGTMNKFLTGMKMRGSWTYDGTNLVIKFDPNGVSIDESDPNAEFAKSLYDSEEAMEKELREYGEVLLDEVFKVTLIDDNKIKASRMESTSDESGKYYDIVMERIN